MCLLWPSLELTPNDCRGLLYCRIQHFVNTVNLTVTVATYLRVRRHSWRGQKKMEGMKWCCSHFPSQPPRASPVLCVSASRHELWSVLASWALPSPAAVRLPHAVVLAFRAQGPSETWWAWEETPGSAGDWTKHQKGLCTAGQALQLCAGQEGGNLLGEEFSLLKSRGECLKNTIMLGRFIFWWRRNIR